MYLPFSFFFTVYYISTIISVIYVICELFASVLPANKKINSSFGYIALKQRNFPYLLIQAFGVLY